MKRLVSWLTGKRAYTSPVGYRDGAGTLYRPAVIGRWFYAALAEAAIRPAYGW